MVYSRSSKLIPILRYSSLVLLFLAISAQAGHKSTATLSSKTTTNLQDSIIYFGDPKVFVGEPFSISCILSISEPIQWFKDGEIIKNKHNNIRHLLRDEHSFITTETGVEGKGNLIEAKLSVKSALLIHDGKYKCNAIFPYEFTLRVIENDEDGDDDNDDTINQWITAEKNYHKNNNKNKNNFTPNSNELTSGKLGIITTQQIHHQQQHHHHDHHNINGKLLKNDSVNNNFIIKKRIDADNNNKNGDNDDDDDDKLLTTIDTKLLSEFSLISGEDDGINENDKEIVDYLTTSISTIFITESSIINNLTATKMTTLGTVSSGTGTTTTTKATAAATTSSIKKIKTINYDDNNKSNDKKLIDDNKFVKLRKNKEIIIKANYQHIEEKIVTFEIRKSLHLNCNVTTPTANDYKITWSKDGQDVNAVESLIGRYNLHDNNQLFEISRTQESDAGHWKCSLVVDDEEAFADFNVYANLVLKLPENSAVVEGEKLTIHCEAFGTDPSFFWKIGEKIYNESDDRVVLKVDEKGCKNALFIYEIAELTDRADYMCIAYNNASILLNQAPRNATTFLRVKGKLAALWPFIGICAEVFVLCAIILIYEKRRNKQDLDESDTDQSPEQKNDQHVKDSDVRQRK